jgi:hypothetical protein
VRAAPLAALLLLATAYPGEAQVERETWPLGDAQLEIEYIAPPKLSAIPEALRAAREAASELHELLAIENPAGRPNGLGALATRAEPVAGRPALAPPIPDARVVATLQRALGVCYWTGGALGPFGGEVYALWGLRTHAAGSGGGRALPGDGSLAAAIEGNRCEIALDPRRPDLGLGTERSRLDLYGFTSGPIVDRVIEVLADHGLVNVRVRHGSVLRAAGGGSSGVGWVTLLPQLPGASAAESVILRDRALAIVTAADGAFARGGESFTRHFDLRTGRPASGSLGVFVSTLNAADAETVGLAMFVLGTREGQFKLGALDPQPAARWVQGSGEGEPLTVDSRWSAVFGRSARAERPN